MGNHSLSVLTITPQQAFEISRLLDRTGNGVVAAHRLLERRRSSEDDGPEDRPVEGEAGASVRLPRASA